MIPSKPQSTTDNEAPSPDFRDAFDVGATFLAAGIVGALCHGLVWSLWSPFMRALMPPEVEETEVPPLRPNRTGSQHIPGGRGYRCDIIESGLFFKGDGL